MENVDIIFWLVWGKDKSAPVKKHYTEDAAILEAKRLCKTNPGITFYILKSSDAYLVTLPEPEQVILKAPLQHF